MSATDSATWFNKSGVAGLAVYVALLLTLCVAPFFLPWYLGFVALAGGVAVFLFLVLHNPELWLRRTIGAIVVLIAGTKFLAPRSLKFTSDYVSFVAELTHENETLTIICLTVLAFGLLLYDLALRGHLDSLLGYLSTALAAARSGNRTTIKKTVGSQPITQAPSGGGPAIAFQDSPNFGTQIFPTATITDINAEITRCADYLKSNQPQYTRELLLNLKRDHAHRFDDRAHFRTLANLGHASEALEEFQEAARYFIAAKPYQPRDEQARSLEAAAYLLLDDRPKAYSLACGILEDFQTSVTAWAVKIRAAPDTQSATSLRDSVPILARNTVEVLDALAHRAMREKDYALAEQLAREALSLMQQSEQLKQRLAVTLLSPLCNPFDFETGPRSLNALEQKAVDEATALLDRCIATARDSGNKKSEARSLLNRAIAHRILGQDSDASDDYRAASLLNPDDPEIVRQASVYLWRRKEYDRALKLFTRPPHAKVDPFLAILQAGLLRERNAGDDAVQAQAVLEAALPHLANGPPDIRAGLVEAFVDGCLVQSQFSRAREVLKKYGGQLPSVALHTLSASIDVADGKLENAKQDADLASKALVDDTPHGLVASLGLVYSRMDRHGEGLAVVRRYVATDHISTLTRLSIELARRAMDDQYVLVLGENLRKARIFDVECVTEELKRLTHYHAYDKALAVISESLENTSDAAFRSSLRLYELQINVIREGDKGAFPKIESLPRPDELNVTQLPGLVPFLVSAFGRAEAADYVYRAVRSRAVDSHALKALMLAVGIGDEERAEIPLAEVVAVSTAVHYRALDDKSDHWFVIEQHERRDQGVIEHAADSDIAASVLGKKVGEKFTVRKSHLQDREAVIVEILPAPVFRARDALLSWEERFPQEDFLKKIVLGPPEEGAVPDLSIIFRQLDDRANEVNRLVGLYAANPVPITLLAEAFGATVADALIHIGTRDDVYVRCCRGTADEFAVAANAMRSYKTIVIDEVGLATVFAIGADRHFELMNYKLVVTESTLDEIKNRRRALKKTGAVTARIGTRFVFHENTKEAFDASNERLTEFLQRLEKSCEISDGLPLAKCSFELRTKLEDLFGQRIAEAAAVAKDRNALLWTDDFAIAEVLRNEMKIRRVWTEVVLRQLLGSTAIHEAEYERDILELLKNGYEFTPLFPNVFFRAARESEWDATRFPLNKIVKWFGMADRHATGLAQLLGAILPRLWREAVFYEQRAGLTKALCRQVLRHPNGRQVLNAAVNTMDRLFEDAIKEARECKAIIEECLKVPNEGRLIIPD